MALEENLHMLNTQKDDHFLCSTRIDGKLRRKEDLCKSSIGLWLSEGDIKLCFLLGDSLGMRGTYH